MMWDLFSEYFSIVEQNISFITMLVIIYLVTMVIFWYESKNAQKNTNSIFDMWFFSSIVMIIWGRIGFIITFWDEFNQWNWFWLPYERYGDMMYIFRAMPWRLFKIWDGGFLFSWLPVASGKPVWGDVVAGEDKAVIVNAEFFGKPCCINHLTKKQIQSVSAHIF